MPATIYTPSELDVKTRLPEHLRRYTPEALYLLHAIECRRVFYRGPRAEYVPLKAAYLRNVMTRQQCKPLVAAMEKAELIDCDHEAVRGKKSFGYRLGALLAGSVFKPQPTPPRIKKRIDKLPVTKLTLPVHLHLHHWLHQPGIEYEDAKNSLRVDAHAETLLPIDMLADGAFWFTVCKYGRVHTNVTSLPSELRRFIRFNVNGVKGGVRFIDVVNSQPFFLSVVLANYHNSGNSLNSFHSFSKNGNCKLQPEGGEEGRRRHAHYDGQITIQHILRRLDYPADVDRYIALTERGALYEFLQQLWGCHRDRAKKLFFSFVLYCRKFDNPYRTVFGEHFPNVLSVIDRLKAKDYRHCGQMLQRAESAVVVHGACEALRAFHPEVPLLTLHDSIGTTEEHLPLVLDVFKGAFTGLGLTPRLKTE